ncbi:MAG: hypothetical protein MUF51_01760, partial [Vicinamibacteria bacterium]|nr:hypothetical protein [Vicinamibacteria bacterium]
PPGIENLSVWNIPLGHALFWEEAGALAVADWRLRGLSDDEIGERMAAAVLDAIVRLGEGLRFESVVLGGGLTDSDSFTHALRARASRWPIRIHPDGVFHAERGGKAILARHACPDGLVVDVGQTTIKLSARGQRRVIERDLEALPLRLIGARAAPDPELGTRAAKFIAQAIAAALVDCDCRSAELVLGLPCPIDDALQPGACSYGWHETPELLALIFETLAPLLSARLGSRAWRAFVLNDAELAAESARETFAALRSQRVLVLTLGFGPGGAVIS